VNFVRELPNYVTFIFSNQWNFNSIKRIKKGSFKENSVPANGGYHHEDFFYKNYTGSAIRKLNGYK